MKTMILDAAYSLIKFVRVRWEFLAVFTLALGFLTAAAITWSLGLAMVGAIVAFAAGEAKGGQILCNDCALETVPVSPEFVEAA